MSTPNEPVLDEIQWRAPHILAEMHGLHSNSVLFYFARSPFFEPTSNNATIMTQAMMNASMFHLIQTREAFEERLRSMLGLEFMVAEEPAESGPGMGTGVWVIRKQTREDTDEGIQVVVHATYFVVGENIYMAPTLADVMASRLMSISLAIGNILPTANSMRKWRPSTGHIYDRPKALPPSKAKNQESKENTPLPESQPQKSNISGTAQAPPKNEESALERAAEEAFWMHYNHGGEYIDDNPITGRPGEFHLSSTGRKPVPPLQQIKKAGLGGLSGPPAIDTTVGEKIKGKEKTPKSATAPGKLKRRKSTKLASNTPTPKTS